MLLMRGTRRTRPDGLRQRRQGGESGARRGDVSRARVGAMDEGAFAPPDRELMELLQERPVIALVGASSRAERPSHTVMRDLLEQRYTVIPVNPNETHVLGLPCYPDLYAVPRRVELVDVFRRAEATPAVARAAAEVGARILWLQLGVVNH